MKTRTVTVTEVKVFILMLNLMTAKGENCTSVALAFDRKRLVDFYKDEIVKPYIEKRHSSCASECKYWHKAFRKGGPLEWYNPLRDINKIETFGQGIRTVWLDIEEISEFNVVIIDPDNELISVY